METCKIELGFKWVEECFNPEDYWSYKELKRRADNKIMVSGGEHDASRYGFRMLIEFCDIDILQPDVSWCGGLTELIKIGNLAESHGKYVVPLRKKHLLLSAILMSCGKS